MAANIGPLVAKITANAEGVSGGVNDAVARLEKGAGAIGAAGKKAGDAAGGGMLSGLKSGLAGIGGVLGSALDAAAGVAKIGAVGIGAVIAGGVAGYMAQTDKIKALGKGSLLSGFGTEDLQTLSVLTGNLDLATSAATKFSEAISAAAAAGPGSDNPFSRFGIDAAALAGDPAQAMGVFFDHLNRIESKFEKLATAEGVFKDVTADLFATIERGSAGFAKARTQMDAFGATIGPGMVAMAKQAEIATRAIGLFKDGVLNQVAIGAGAVLAELGDRFGTLGFSFKDLGKTAVEVGRVIAQAGNVIWEAWSKPKVLSAVWDAFKAGFKVLGAYLESAITEAVGRALKAIGGRFEGPGDKLLHMSKMSGNWASGAGMSSFRLFLREVVNATENGPKINEVFDGAIDRINKIGQAANENNPFATWMASAKEWEAGNKTSFESLFEKINKAKFLTDKLPANLTFEQIAKMPELSPVARARLGSSLFGDLKQFMPTYTPVGAMERGSREAYSAVQEYRGVGSQNIQEGIKAAIEEANRQQREQIRVAEATLDAVRDGAVIVVKGVN